MPVRVIQCGNWPKTATARLPWWWLVAASVAPIGSKFGSNARELLPGMQEDAAARVDDALQRALQSRTCSQLTALD